MLRITTITTDKVVLKLEGKLAGPWVDELMKTVLRTDPRRPPLEIDVWDLTYADINGEKALRWLHRMGVHFKGKGMFSEYLFHELKIPLCSRQTNSPEVTVDEASGASALTGRPS
jgi:hypothetical protein